MIQIVTQNSINDMLRNPDDYIDDYEDIVLLRVIKPNEPAVMVMLGHDDVMESYYFVVEDDEVSEYTYCKTEMLERKFSDIVYELEKRE